MPFVFTETKASKDVLIDKWHVYPVYLQTRNVGITRVGISYYVIKMLLTEKL